VIRIGLIAAVLLVAVVNAIALFGVMRNRGLTDARIVLTERELAVWRGEREDTALYLELEWQRRSDWNARRDWFGEEKLRELGFDVSVDVTDLDDEDAPRAYARRLDRRALAVFEHDGPAWDDWREEQTRLHEEQLDDMRRRERGDDEIERSERSHRRMLASASRLLAVDVGLDGGELRRLYPDGSTHLIVPVVASLHVESEYDRDRGELIERWLEGSITRLRVPYLHVPHQHRDALEHLIEEAQRAEAATRPPYPAMPSSLEGEPRYRVAVSWGRRFEPWITSIERIEGAEAAQSPPEEVR